MSAPSVHVVSPGLQTTIQDGGRPGYLSRGIPPAGAQDHRSFALASMLVGNDPPPPPLSVGDPGQAGLEVLAMGPTLRFGDDRVVAITGGELAAELDGEPVPGWTAVAVPAGATLRTRKVGPGARAYIAISGGMEVPRYLGSRSTYVRGGQGGMEGRALRTGDVLQLGQAGPASPGAVVRPGARRELGPPWTVRVVPGPQDHLFEQEGLDTFFSAEWQLSPTSDRMGFRFIGPPLALRKRPDYLVRDAGSGPADIVDDITPVGGIQVPGGIEPIAMGVENPTAGGYAKIGVVVSTDLGVLGQIRPLDAVHFQWVELDEALRIATEEMARLGPGVLEVAA